MLKPSVGRGPDTPCSPDCPSRVHHTYSAYRRGCRSEAAVTAEHRYQKLHRTGRAIPLLVSGLGTSRRIHALQAIGYRQRDIADAAGLPMKAFDRYTRCDKVTRRVAAAIDSAYLALRDRRGPSDKAARHAARQGWPRPDEWLPGEIDDPNADPRAADVDDHEPDALTVAQAAAGDIPARSLSRPEFDAAVDVLKGKGMLSPAIADRLRCTEHDVLSAAQRLGRARKAAS